MRLLLWLAAVLQLAATALSKSRPVAEFALPNGLADGSILTFHFKHNGNDPMDGRDQGVVIDFYAFATVGIDEMAWKEINDITAHLDIQRHHHHPIVTNSYVNGKWKNPVANEGVELDELPTGDGWWRIDVYKHDSKSASVFLQGFWQGVRTFEKPLTDIRSVYVTSLCIGEPVEMQLKLPRANFPPIDANSFKRYADPTPGEDLSQLSANLTTIKAFPVGARVEMTTMMRSMQWTQMTHPAIMFVSASDGNCFLRIYQSFTRYVSQMVYIGDGEYKDEFSQIECTQEAPHGHLQHMRLERTNETAVTLHVLYKEKTGMVGAHCTWTLKDPLAKYLDEPFQLRSHDESTILYLDHFVPRAE